MSTRDEVAEVFNDSLVRCNLEKLFIKKFYARFFASNPEVPRLFASTDMQHQEEMLSASLYMIMLSSLSPQASDQLLHQAAAKHHQRHIPLDLYDTWLECLIETVAEVDPNYNESIESAWRTTMQAGVSYMKSTG